MAPIRARTAVVLFTALPMLLSAAVPAPLDYALGDVARADVVAPVALQVVNPDATDALKQKVAEQVLLIVRHTPQSAAEAERELRETAARVRTVFLSSLQRVLNGRAPEAADIDTPLYQTTIEAVRSEAPRDFPFARLAPLWVRGLGDDAGVEALVEPLRAVLGQPIVNNRTDSPLPATQPVRLVPVKSATERPSARELELAGTTVPSARVLSLWRARRLVETHFPAGQEDLGRFVASYVRVNAYPDPVLTEIARAQRLEGLAVNDTYEPGQVIIRQGETIDRRALSALTVLREKSMIGRLQTQLQQEQSLVGVINRQTTWMFVGLGVLAAGLLVIVWRLRPRPSSALVLAGTAPTSPGNSAFGAGTSHPAWRERALLAESQAERAHDAIRRGVLGWMREKIVQTLFRHRQELLTAQQRAEAEMRELEQRLEQLQTPLQERILAYEKRIEELEKDLAAKGEEYRELIGARISVARQQLTVERERGRFGTN